ncbi:sensor histidine kinase [Streptomyces sp. NPDC060184]|uniref:sensor histidine kinase n=1 Tax=Streptomyces sp. NPDC060184 TaxID=3347064 RepID=UPI00365B155C
MDWHLPFAPAVRRLITTFSLLALAMTWLADLALLSFAPDAFSPATNWLPVLVTGPLAALTVAETRRSPPMRWRVAGVVAVSLTLTAVCLAVAPAQSSFGGLEGAALIALVIRTIAQAPSTRAAALSTAALGVAALLLPLRMRSWAVFVPGGYVLTVALTIGITLGCAIRALEARRRRNVADVRQAERLALARDLHDLIAHHMTGIIVQAHAATAIHETAPEKVEPILRNIARSGTETLESMRRLVRVLREEGHVPQRPGDLLSELAELTAAHSAPGASGSPACPARLEATASARTAQLSPEVEISVFRVAQEALTNVRRHAPGSRAAVRLDVDAGWLWVTVTNTASPKGSPSPAGGSSGFGLIGLRERVEALDGTLRAGGVPGGGWEVGAGFPLHAPPASAAACSAPAAFGP